jgi:hypothetical protein
MKKFLKKTATFFTGIKKIPPTPNHSKCVSYRFNFDNTSKEMCEENSHTKTEEKEKALSYRIIKDNTSIYS